jgi:acyl carrier protein
VHDAIREVARVALAENLDRPPSGVGAQDAAGTARGILELPQRQEENNAEADPPCVERPEAPRPLLRHGPYNNRAMTRDEIERTLIEIVRREKRLDALTLTPATLLADAGIDSLDALTILFAIEEEFSISIPDTTARAIKTLGDLVDAVTESLSSK